MVGGWGGRLWSGFDELGVGCGPPPRVKVRTRGRGKGVVYEKVIFEGLDSCWRGSWQLDLPLLIHQGVQVDSVNS